MTGQPTSTSESAPNRKSALSESQRQLVELMQRLNFGVIEQLTVRCGQPVLCPEPRVTREHKFGGANGARPEAALLEFSLKPQVRELIDAIGGLPDCVVDRIEVKHGLPFRMLVNESAAI